MKRFEVSGMSCAACSARVEKAVNNLNNVTKCSVNLLTQSMEVEGSATDSEIISAVEKAGYGAAPTDSEKVSLPSDKSYNTLHKRLWISVLILVALMYFSMGHMFGITLPSFLNSNPFLVGVIQMILSAGIMFINKKFFINGFNGIRHKSPNMDTLVSIGSLAAFVYSLWTLVIMLNSTNQHELLHGLYFESAAMILTLITVGKMFEERSKGKTTNAIKGLLDLTPKTVTLLIDGKEETTGVENVKVGDAFLVRAGESIAVDGIVLEGEAAVDESSLTGESIPVDKKTGDSVCAATISKSGFIKCRATRVGKDTTISQIVKIVSDAAASKAPIARIADKVSGVFVPIVLLIALITCAVWILLGENFSFALARAISVLVISCPCALGLATPVAIMVANGAGAKHSILFKTAASLENTGKTNIVVLDKTGTITKGEPLVTDIITSEKAAKNRLFSVAYSLEKMSEHPLAAAVVKKAEEENVEHFKITDFKTITGQGLYAKDNGNILRGGNISYISKNAVIDDNIKQEFNRLSSDGKTVFFFSENDLLLGIFAVSDTVKEDSRIAIKKLHNMGIETVMLTGDNENTANAVANEVGIDRVIAGVLPNDKANEITRLRSRGRVIMVGDGINDAPALTSADIGMAIGAGADIAIDSADIVLVNSSLSDVVSAIKLSRATLRNIKQNLFWAFFYNFVCIPLAAGVFINIGLQLNPMFSAAAMSLSSICVVLNALRLNFFKAYKTNKRGIKNMEVTLKIDGMMCVHCEEHVKKALLAVDGVKDATVSHKDGTAVVKVNDTVNSEILKKAVEEQGYKVIE